jgi:coatomer protein complex subunit epsilon
MADQLFSVRTNFYIGAFQTAISEASHLTGLTEEQKLEREIFTHRAYIEIGSYDVRLSPSIVLFGQLSSIC